MSMDLQDIQERITALNDALIEKNYPLPDCDLTIEGSGNATIWIKAGRHNEASRVFDSVEVVS